MEPRLIQAPVSLVFSEASLNHDDFEREYHQLSESNENAIKQCLKIAKARGETSDTDPVLLNLVAELHNKIDALEMFLRDEEPNRVSLTTKISRIHDRDEKEWASCMTARERVLIREVREKNNAY